MSTSAVKAGRAYVELSVKDRMSRGLDDARARFMAWGTSLTVMGTAVLATSAGIFSALGSAVNAYESYGSSLNDLSNSTGVAVEDLSALQYAAKLNGISTGQLTTGLKGLIKFTGGVASGSKKAAQTLAELGINQEAFLKAGTVGRMNMVADSLAGIEDGTERANAAMAIFGKGGLEMARLLKGGSEELNKLIAEAERLGAVMTTEEAQKADELGDSWDKLSTAGGGVARAIGVALADSLITIYSGLTEVTVASREFIKNNQWLVKSVAIAALVLAGLGTVLVVAGVGGMVLAGIMAGLNAMIVIASAAWAALGMVKAIVVAVSTWLATTLTAEGLAALWATIQTWLLNAAISVLAFVSGAAAAALTALLSPLGLFAMWIAAVSIALVAGIAYHAMYTESGQQMVGALAMQFRMLVGTASQVARGVFDALLAGNWSLAGQILMKGLDVAVQQGLLSLRVGFEQWKHWLYSLFATMVSGYGHLIDMWVKQTLQAVNLVRSQMGLAEIKQIPIASAVGKGLQAAGAAMQQNANVGRNKAMAKLTNDLATSQKELNDLTAQATEERKTKAQERRDKMEEFFKGAVGGLTMPTNTGASVGTFNSAVAGMLGSSAPAVAERTAKATEAIEKHMEKLVDLADENGLVFGE